MSDFKQSNKSVDRLNLTNYNIEDKNISGQTFYLTNQNVYFKPDNMKKFMMGSDSMYAKYHNTKKTFGRGYDDEDMISKDNPDLRTFSRQNINMMSVSTNNQSKGKLEVRFSQTNQEVNLSNKFDSRKSSDLNQKKNKIGKIIESDTNQSQMNSQGGAIIPKSASAIGTTKSHGKYKLSNEAKLSKVFSKKGSEGKDLNQNYSKLLSKLISNPEMITVTSKGLLVKPVHISQILKDALSKEKKLKKYRNKVELQKEWENRLKIEKTKQINERIREKNKLHTNTRDTVSSNRLNSNTVANAKLYHISNMKSVEPVDRRFGRNKHSTNKHTYDLPKKSKHNDISLGREIRRLRKNMSDEDADYSVERKHAQTKSRNKSKKSKIRKANKAKKIVESKQTYADHYLDQQQSNNIEKSMNQDIFKPRVQKKSDLVENEALVKHSKIELIEFMENKKRQFEQQRAQEELEAKEKAQRLIQNLRSLNTRTHKLASKKPINAKGVCKTSKIQELLSRKQVNILAGTSFIQERDSNDPKFFERPSPQVKNSTKKK